jgi:Amt family ammonium transporter
MLKLSSFTKWAGIIAIFLLIFVPVLPVMAQEEVPSIDTGDTAWLLMSCALVMMMTSPGLALFYGGLVSKRNVLSTLMHSFFMLCIISIVWVVIGYSIAFGDDTGGLMGGFNYAFFNGVDAEPSGTIPHVVFAMFQGMFAIITVALISGAIAERMTFSSYVIFGVLWSVLIYSPLCHWVWHSDGWLFKMGALDFAGGTVVHISSAASALVACILVGPRLNFPKNLLPPHSVPLTLVGGSMLWFGWFGFNAGSALAANGTAGMAFATTHIATAMSGLVWGMIEWFLRGKPTALGVVTGAVAGMVAITPAAGFVNVQGALAIGLGAGIICYWGVNKLKFMFNFDDSLDVVGVHGLGGTWGAIATGIFATESGLVYTGEPAQLITQIIGAGAGWAWAGIGTLIILSVIKLFVPLRVSREEEMTGLDLSLHNEVAYNE